MMRFQSRIWMVAVFSLLMPLPVEAAESGAATLVGSYRDWFVYRADTVNGFTCYALSEPRESQPSDVQRGDIFFLVSAWPGTARTEEPSVVPGYPYGDGSPVSTEIGGQRFNFDITRNEGDAGGAWIEDTNQERRLIAAMKGGSNMIVTGTSARGTLTRDTYSLAGVTAALEQVEAGCN